MLVDRSTTGAIGSTKALAFVDSDAESFPLGPLVDQIATNIYGGHSDQLLVTFFGDSGAPALSKERGVPLAEAVAASIERSELGRRLAVGGALQTATREQLAELGQMISPREIPPAERELLASLLIPAHPRAAELPRVATYAILLSLSKRHGEDTDETHLFRASVAGSDRAT